jgi:hypothetical protein
MSMNNFYDKAQAGGCVLQELVVEALGGKELRVK